MSPRSPTPLSEGEVRSEDGEKVTKSTHRRTDSDIDSSARHASSSRSSRPLGYDSWMSDRNSHFASQGRDRDRSRSPYRRNRSGSRSPYRATRDSNAEKRRRRDDHYGKNVSDPRRHKVYEDTPFRDYGHSTYRDPDRPQHHTGASASADNRDRKRVSTRESHGNRDRDRSRSPYRAPPSERPSSRHSTSTVTSADITQQQHVRTPTIQNGSTPQPLNRKAGTQMTISQSQQPAVSYDVSKASVQGTEQTEPEHKLSEAELIEQRRKKREAIRKKHAASTANDSLLRATLQATVPSSATSPGHESGDVSELHSPPSSIDSPGTPRDGLSAPVSPAQVVGLKDEDLANPIQVNNTTDNDQAQSAADYDPNEDVDEDRPEFKRQELPDAAVHRLQKDIQEMKATAATEKSVDEFDMFAEDDIDMFTAEELPVDKTASKQARALDQSMLDNWDYPDGHYRIINGELLNGRYAVEQQVGKGSFATVVRAVDTDTGDKVAIKIALRNDTMLKAGQKEMQFLERLNERDPDDKRHIIRLLGQFMHKGHLCLVFEGMHLDLREVLKKFGRNVGINLDAVKMYAYQMFQALSLLRTAEVLHGDLKPDNILINEKRTLVKICDFGTATLQQDAELTPYLVSRFYRAPEVILGMDLDPAIDMWAIGCTLYELYTGCILFNGSDNNRMLRVIQEARGKLPNRLIKRAKLADKYFDENFTFYGYERDKMTGNIVPRAMHFGQGLPGKDLKTILSGNVSKMQPDVLRDHNTFVDLLDKCLQLDPEKRIRPKDALHHNFFARSSSHAKPKAPVTSTHIFRPITVQHSG